MVRAVVRFRTAVNQTCSLERMQRFGERRAAHRWQSFGDVVIAGALPHVDRIHDREGVAAPDDTQQVLDAAVTHRGVDRSHRLAAATRRNVPLADLARTGHHEERRAARKGAQVGLIFASSLILSLSGCDGHSSSASSSRTLVVAYGADESPITINRERLGRYPLNASICETLVTLGQDFRVHPGLASRWTPLEPHGVRLILRRNITFSDGTPLDARAVVYTLAHAARLKLGYSFLSESSAVAIDDSTVEIRSTRPNQRLIEQLVHPTYGIMSPSGDPARNPVCTGPFRLAEYKAHDHLTVVRNARYAGVASKLDTIVFRFIPDENTRVLALRAGDADLAYDVSRDNANALAAVPGFQVVTAPPGTVLMMFMNRHGAPPYDQLADSALRAAIAHAIDRRTLVERVLGSRTSALVSTVNPPVMLGEFVSVVAGVPWDTVQARHLVGNRRRPLRLVVNSNVIERAEVEYVQAQLARAGLQVAIEILDAGTFESRLNSGSFDMDMERPSQNDANPAFLLSLRWYSRSGTRSAAFTHASPTFDRLAELSIEATDPVALRRAAADATHQLVDVEIGAIPLAGISRSYAMRDRVHGFVAHPSRLNQGWGSVWLAP